MADSPKISHVYIIQSSAGPIKVGKSARPADRLEEFRIAHYDTLNLVFTHKLNKNIVSRVERKSHELLEPWLVRSEWYSCDLKIAINKVQDAISLVPENTMTAGDAIKHAENLNMNKRKFCTYFELPYYFLTSCKPSILIPHEIEDKINEYMSSHNIK